MKELILNREIEELYCPLTGQQILFPDDSSTSPALLFIYIPEAEAFEYTSEEFRKEYPDQFDENDKAEYPVAFFKSLKKDHEWGYHKLLLTHGVCASISLCFDMNYEPESEWSLFKK